MTEHSDQRIGHSQLAKIVSDPRLPHVVVRPFGPQFYATYLIGCVPEQRDGIFEHLENARLRAKQLNSALQARLVVAA